MIPKKIDLQTANAIKVMLQKFQITHSRVTIDLERQTVEAEDDEYSIDDLLEAAGTLTPDRGKELLDEVKRSREEWDS
ncbi:hypothetical protein [Paenibacillus hexagrammi]|uniref:Uncharacterized protein n=1 Tax=Paenibacillus hexagrammi TaxID=2908839 RepID=A0ABY3SHF7_9BACL|nr:hypothetical protein [Paenibacillus sp. YPD9-1]UJF32626.1 hypothetical protein L0M14_23820 [Paenibacillus sp. YPD9-1]